MPSFASYARAVAATFATFTVAFTGVVGAGVPATGATPHSTAHAAATQHSPTQASSPQVPASGITARVTTPVAAAPVATAGWAPPTGLLFSDPVRRPYAIRNRIINLLDHTPRGATATLVSFTVSQPDIVAAVKRAHARGVKVRIVADEHTWTSTPVRSLRQQLGTNTANQSWVTRCHGPCRATGTVGTMHIKAYLFSQTGSARNVVVTGSANLSGGERTRWNMIRTSVDPYAYRNLVGLVDQMRRDPSNVTRPLRFATLTGDATIAPYRGMTRASDPVARVLDSTTCTYRTGGRLFRSKVRVMQYTWRGTRGKWLAHAVKDAHDRGCDVAVIVGLLGHGPGSIMASRTGRGSVPLRRAISYRAGSVERFMHSKALTVSGRRNGAAASTVVQGSFNYSDLGLVSDEFTETYTSARDVATFGAEFDTIWAGLR